MLEHNHALLAKFLRYKPRKKVTSNSHVTRPRKNLILWHMRLGIACVSGLSRQVLDPNTSRENTKNLRFNISNKGGATLRDMPNFCPGTTAQHVQYQILNIDTC